MLNPYANNLSPNLRPTQTAAVTPGQRVKRVPTEAVTPRSSIQSISDLPLWMTALIVLGAYKLIVK